MENNQLKSGDFFHFISDAHAGDDDQQTNYRRPGEVMSVVTSHILKFVDSSKTQKPKLS